MKGVIQTPRNFDTIFFFSVVQHIRDLILYEGTRKRNSPWKAYVTSYEWIVEDKPMQWGESDLIVTFSEALEILEIPPENAAIIRDGLIRCINKPREVKRKICREIYADLCWQYDEIEPLWIHLNSNIPRAANLDEV